MIASRFELCARRPATHAPAVGQLRHPRADRVEADDDGRDSVGLLTRSSAASHTSDSPVADAMAIATRGSSSISSATSSPSMRTARRVIRRGP